MNSEIRFLAQHLLHVGAAPLRERGLNVPRAVA